MGGGGGGRLDFGRVVTVGILGVSTARILRHDLILCARDHLYRDMCYFSLDMLYKRALNGFT